MAGVMRLVLVRMKDVGSNPLKPLAEFVKNADKPLLISPAAWREEDGLSHHGYVLDGLKLKQLAAIAELESTPGTSELELSANTAAAIEKALLTRGLRINSLAE